MLGGGCRAEAAPTWRRGGEEAAESVQRHDGRDGDSKFTFKKVAGTRSANQRHVEVKRGEKE